MVDSMHSHAERGNENMERGNENMERGNENMERGNEKNNCALKLQGEANA